MLFAKEFMEIASARQLIKEINDSDHIPFQKKPAMIEVQKKLIKANAFNLVTDLGVIGSLGALYFSPAAAGVVATGVSVMAKAYAVYAKDKTNHKSMTTRKPYEEILAKGLMSEYIGRFGESDTSFLSENVSSSFSNTINSLDYMMGYNYSLSKLKSSPKLDSFLKSVKSVYFKAYKKVGNVLNSLMTESENKFIQKLIKNPISKIIPKKFKEHVFNMEEKKKLFDLVERNHKNLDKLKVYTAEREKGVRKDREALKSDIDKAIENTYSNAVASGVKWGVCALMSDFIVSQRKYKSTKFMPEKLLKDYKQNLNYIKELYKKTKDEKYQVLSLLAGAMLNDINNNKKVTFDLVKNFNQEKLKSREEIFLAVIGSIDDISKANGKLIIPEVFNIEEEFDLSFRELLRQRGKSIHIDKNNEIRLNNLSVENTVTEKIKPENDGLGRVELFNPMLNAYIDALDEDKRRKVLKKLLNNGIKLTIQKEDLSKKSQRASL